MPAPAVSDTRVPRGDYLIAAALALVPFAVYVTTMFPGLTEIGDATKFAFIGKVMGTPHAPGYPLYIVVSHLWSYVPWGTLAHRMNGLSAVLGACAVAVSYLLSRRLGVGRVGAAGAALALGFGDAFWSRAQYAKYYTLNATLIAWGMFALLRWGQTVRPRDLYWAVAIFALASGNHLTIVGLLPALVLFALTTAPRQVLRPITLVTIAAIVLAGLSQYLLIWLRTAQGAPYLEARASSLAEVWGVMTARRFAHEIGAFSTDQLWSTRIPLVWGLIRTEFGLAGLGLAAAGAVVLLRRAVRPGLLLTVGAFGVAALTANMGSQEDQGFMLPVFVLAWPLVGVAIDAVWRLWPDRRALMIGARTVAVMAALLVPASLIATNYARNDHRADTAEEDYIDALIAAVPDRAGIIADEYRINMMLTYKYLGEGVSAARGIGLVRHDPESLQREHASGRPIFALPSGRRRALPYGVRFELFEFPVPASARQLRQQLPAYRLLSVPVCADVGDREWKDVTAAAAPHGRLSVRIDNFRPFDAELLLWTAADDGSAAAVVGITGVGHPGITSTVYQPALPRDAAALAARLRDDGVTLPPDMAGAPRLVRYAIRVNDEGEFVNFGLDLGGPVTAALARASVDLVNAKRASVCTHELGDVDAWPIERPGAEVTPRSSTVTFIRGWHQTETDGDGHAFRWTNDRATLILPLDTPRSGDLIVSAEPFGTPGGRTGPLTLILNGHPMGARATVDGEADYRWHVPADRWRPGLNDVTIDVEGATSPRAVGLSDDGRRLGVRFLQLRLSAPPQPSAGR